VSHPLADFRHCVGLFYDASAISYKNGLARNYCRPSNLPPRRIFASRISLYFCCRLKPEDITDARRSSEKLADVKHNPFVAAFEALETMKLIKAWSLALVHCAAKCTSASFNVWNVQGGENRADSSTAENKVRVNHQGLIATLVEGSGESANLSFVLPTEVLECQLVPSQLMAPELQDMHPEIKVVVGQCSNDGSAIMVVNENQANSMSTTLYNSRGEVFYVDHKNTDTDPEIYTLVNKKDILLPEGVSWSDSVVGGRRLGKQLLKPSRALQSLKGVTYRMALATTKEYSALYGNTVATVLEEVVRGMARVNGIYLRELGVMFQLIATTTNLFCLGEADCTFLTDNDPSNLLDQVTDYITNVRNVPSSDFDIGHIFSNSGGGVAFLGVVCSTEKAKGVTGLPVGATGIDPFFVDYVAHEVCLESLFLSCQYSKFKMQSHILPTP
jgi:Metallo-peptidase family M12B Reprolysin-like